MIEIEQLLDAQRAWQAVSADDEIIIRKMAGASLEKCADAIAVLGRNLGEIGYTWVISERLSSSVIERNILNLEKILGLPIPEILVLFWEKVGSASFVDLAHYQHVDFWREQSIVGPGYFCDGLHVDPCSDEWASSICDDFLDWKENRAPAKSDNFLLSLSPDGYHKDKISGGAPYGIHAKPSWKPIWQNFEWSGTRRPVTAPAGTPDFLSYLRATILECAGFPAFLGLPAFDPIRERLLRGVPIF
jgi:hypothetical protein